MITVDGEPYPNIKPGVAFRVRTGVGKATEVFKQKLNESLKDFEKRVRKDVAALQVHTLICTTAPFARRPMPTSAPMAVLSASLVAHLPRSQFCSMIACVCRNRRPLLAAAARPSVS